MFKIFTFASCAIIAFMTGSIGHAQMSEVHCGLDQQITKILQTQAQPVRQGYGMRDPETIIEIWSDPKTQAWTLVQRYANGRACILALGDFWTQDTGLLKTTN